MKALLVSQKQRPHSHSVGYVVAEDVIAVKPPNFDYDNISTEADELFVNPRGWNTRSRRELVRERVTKKFRSYGIPSFAAIQKVLNAVR